ncbi:MAG: peptidoglycan-binding domain-containing protein [Acidiferrobacter sp.]
MLPLRNSILSYRALVLAVACALPMAAFASSGSMMPNGSMSSPANRPHNATMAGHHIAWVKSIQSALNRKEHAHLAVDGKLGAQTMAALKKFQIAHGLPATGRPTKATAKALGI